jgi:hypothetical protein
MPVRTPSTDSVDRSEHGARHDEAGGALELVAVNDLTDSKTLAHSSARLRARALPGEVRHDADEIS